MPETENEGLLASINTLSSLHPEIYFPESIILREYNNNDRTEGLPELSTARAKIILKTLVSEGAIELIKVAEQINMQRQYREHYRAVE